MDPKFQSSFIPKGPVASAGSINPADRNKGRSFFGFVATIIFVLSVVAALGVFGYSLYLSSNIAKMGNDLTTAKASLDPTTINQISRLNSRIISTQTLLAQHTVVSPFFDFLETSTLKTLRWTSFDYTVTSKGIQLNMQGQAQGYNALALQSDIFNKTSFIKSPLFKNLTLDNSGNVTFEFTATLDPSIISYKNYVTNSGVIASPSTASSTTPSSPVILNTASSSTKTSASSVTATSSSSSKTKK